MKYTVLSHSAIKICDNIYIDPFNLKNEDNKAKYIFISHPHYDHLSIEDIKKIANENTKFICTSDSAFKLINYGYKNIKIVAPNKSYDLGYIKFDTFSSYNVNKEFHPKENNWVGYKIYMDGVSLAVLGDTDINADVTKLKCDVLFVPVGGTYTCNIEEAVELTKKICPKIAIPTHYGFIVGDKSLGKKFCELLKNTNIETKSFF